MTNLELQAQLLIAELELYVAAGGSLPVDVITAMNAFRQTELLVTGRNDKQVRRMVAALKSEFGDTNNH